VPRQSRWSGPSLRCPSYLCSTSRDALDRSVPV